MLFIKYPQRRFRVAMLGLGRPEGNWKKKWGELTITENTKVRGFHFASGRKSNDPTNVDYFPTYPYLRRLTLTSESAENYSRPVKKASSNK